MRLHCRAIPLPVMLPVQNSQKAAQGAPSGPFSRVARAAGVLLSFSNDVNGGGSPESGNGGAPLFHSKVHDASSRSVIARIRIALARPPTAAPIGNPETAADRTA